MAFKGNFGNVDRVFTPSVGANDVAVDVSDFVVFCKNVMEGVRAARPLGSVNYVHIRGYQDSSGTRIEASVRLHWERVSIKICQG